MPMRNSPIIPFPVPFSWIKAACLLLLLLVGIASSWQTLYAQEPLPQLVKDINPQGDSYPGNFVATDQALFFVARNSAAERELWKSDGTTAGTVLVKHVENGIIRPGLSVLNNIVYFGVEKSNPIQFELWRSDGTATGTFRLKTINSTGSSGGVEGIVVGNSLLFVASDGIHGQEWWRTDGTEAGTQLVKDINSRNEEFILGPQDSLVLNNNLFFFEFYTDGKFGLWRTDGSDAGTTLIREFTGINGQWQKEPFAFANTLYFFIRDQAGANYLWKSDGTTDGTTEVTKLDPHNGNAPMATFPTIVGSTIFFQVGDLPGIGTFCELWQSDGTAAETSYLANVCPRYSMSELNGKLYFFPERVEGQEVAMQLWQSDGTPTGTKIVKQIGAGRNGYPSHLQNLGNLLYFSGIDNEHGRELWRSEGTEASTLLLKDIQPNSQSGLDRDMGGFYPWKTNFFFAATDGTTGIELWAMEYITYSHFVHLPLITR